MSHSKTCPRCGKDTPCIAGLYRCETCGSFGGGSAPVGREGFVARNPGAIGTGLSGGGMRRRALIEDDDPEAFRSHRDGRSELPFDPEE